MKAVKAHIVRTNTDVRVLYEKRPKTERMDEMCLLQFASEYIILQPSRFGFEKATSSINEDPLDLDANSYDSKAHVDHLSFPLNCSSNSSVVNNSSNSYISHGSKRVDDDKCSPKFVVSALSRTN